MSGTSYSTEGLQGMAAQFAQQYGVPTQLMLDRVTAESSWNPNAIGQPVNVGNGQEQAIGLGQILPSTAANPGYGVTPVDPSNLVDPANNLQFTAQYLGALIAKYGSASAALAQYTGQPASNFTQYDEVATSLPSGGSASGGTTATSTASGLTETTASSSSIQTSSWSAWATNLVLEVIIVVTGMIFVGVGLKMLANPSQNVVQATGNLAKGVAKGVAQRAAVVAA